MKDAPAAVAHPADGRLADVLLGFAFASDLAFGLELEDCVRSCYVGARIAEYMGLAEEERAAVYYSCLLKDAGCTCWTSVLASFWKTDEIAARREAIIFNDGSLAGMLSFLHQHVGAGLGPVARLRTLATVLTQTPAVMHEGWVTACEVSARIAGRLGMPSRVQEILLAMFEHWDGKGFPNGLVGEAIPAGARLVLPAFLLVPFHRVGGRQAAVDLAKKQRGRAFDPAVVDAFLSLAHQDDFWASLEGPDIVDTVLGIEPSSYPTVDEDRLDAIALAFADFIDLKSPYTAAHSRRVAPIAKRIGAVMGCPASEQRSIWRAALVHDLGLVAVPTYYIEKPESSRTHAEREAVRLHPYHAERILKRAPALADFVSAAAAHHENFDGSGYFRGLKSKDIPLPARITAVADRFDELTHERPGGHTLDLDEALRALIAEAGGALDPDIIYAVAGTMGAPQTPANPSAWPAGLTDREVEVLRLAARGLTRRKMGQALGISENTVRHHLEHIYNKTGTSTRVSATLFAIENDLLS